QRATSWDSGKSSFAIVPESQLLPAHALVAVSRKYPTAGDILIADVVAPSRCCRHDRTAPSFDHIRLRPESWHTDSTCCRHGNAPKRAAPPSAQALDSYGRHRRVE